MREQRSLADQVWQWTGKDGRQKLCGSRDFISSLNCKFGKFVNSTKYSKVVCANHFLLKSSLYCKRRENPKKEHSRCHKNTHFSFVAIIYVPVRRFTESSWVCNMAQLRHDASEVYHYVRKKQHKNIHYKKTTLDHVTIKLQVSRFQ